MKVPSSRPTRTWRQTGWASSCCCAARASSRQLSWRVSWRRRVGNFFVSRRNRKCLPAVLGNACQRRSRRDLRLGGAFARTPNAWQGRQKISEGGSHPHLPTQKEHSGREPLKEGMEERDLPTRWSGHHWTNLLRWQQKGGSSVERGKGGQ